MSIKVDLYVMVFYRGENISDTDQVYFMNILNIVLE